MPTAAKLSQHSTAQHSTAQHSTAQHSTAQHSTAVDCSQSAFAGSSASWAVFAWELLPKSKIWTAPQAQA